MEHNRFIIAPSGWIVYAVSDELAREQVESLIVLAKEAGTPLVSVLEALVLTGKAKRVAAIHTFNSMSAEMTDEGEEGTPFYKEDEEEDGD